MEGAAAKNERDPQDVHFVQSGLDETGLSLLKYMYVYCIIQAV